VLDFVEKLRQMSSSDLEPEILATAEHEIPAQHLSASKARKVLGWEPRWPLDDALRETVTWYRAYLSEDRRGP
jgi:CDP-glucose 4,6-dehydratase